MPHIHTEAGQIDGTAEIYIVDTATKTVLLRIHDKYKQWLHVGGHIELDETPEQAAIRETKEEVGLEIELWRAYGGNRTLPGGLDRQEILPPYRMDIHDVDERHRHVSFIYYAKALTTAITENDNEKSSGIKWWTRKEIEAAPDIKPAIKWYALDALEKLCPEA